jgi:uncharacterized protein involved in exopolysaccharide biosynthesis
MTGRVRMAKSSETRTQTLGQSTGARSSMNAQFEFRRLETIDLGAYYQRLVVSALSAVIRRWALIVNTIAAALLLAVLMTLALPRSYTAEALVQPQLFSRSDGSSRSALASIDAASLVASEARLIESPTIARAVVKRLGLQDRPEFASSTSGLGHVLNVIKTAIFPETALSSPLERAARSVRSRLQVNRDTRSYLISIAYTARSPETAAAVANAFAIEYFNAKYLEQLSVAVSTATRELAQRSATYGENHPSFIRATTDLELARQRLQAAINRSPGSDLGNSEGMNLAEPSSAPSSPNGSIILGLAFILGLMVGAGTAIWLDRVRIRNGL